MCRQSLKTLYGQQFPDAAVAVVAILILTVVIMAILPIEAFVTIMKAVAVVRFLVIVTLVAIVSCVLFVSLVALVTRGRCDTCNPSRNVIVSIIRLGSSFHCGPSGCLGPT